MTPISGFPNYFVTRSGHIYSTTRSRQPQLVGWRNSSGYIWITLLKDGVKHKFPAHQLVAREFIPNPLNKPLVCHRNDIPDDNRVENLFWGTSQDNVDDKVMKLRHRYGVNATGTVVLTEQNVRDIRSRTPYYGCFAEWGREFGVHGQTVIEAFRRITWKQLSD